MATKRFRKKPVVIEAVLWTGQNVLEVYSFMHGAPTLDSAVAQDKWFDFENIHTGKDWYIRTLEDGPNGEAKHVASVGDWIIKGVQGELYPCKPDIFDVTYEPVENPSPAPHVLPLLERAIEALRPLSDAVFNDNGDMSVSQPLPTYDECVKAYFVTKQIRIALETPPAPHLRVTEAMVNAADSVLSRSKPGIPDETIRFAIEAAIAAAPPTSPVPHVANFVPAQLLDLTFAVQHNPRCPAPWLVRLPGKRGIIDLKPYGDRLGFVTHQTGDRLGFGNTFEEAARAALATTEVSDNG